MSTRPLDDVRVVEFGHYIAAPAATQILADLGADVIKVEPPSGDQARSIGAYGEGIVVAYNRGKRSVALDLRSPADRERALDLVTSADVVVQNLRPGVLDRLGLGTETLLERQPRLVHVSVTGFSTRSDSAQRAGLDIAAQAESGLMSINGEAEGDPLRVGFPISDVAASYAVVQAVLSGLFRRERTGASAVAEVSLLEVSVHMQSALWGEWHASGVEPRRKGNGQATVAPAADVITTTDGAITVSAYTPEHFARLCRLLGKPWMTTDERFVDNPSRVAHRPALLDEISEVLGLLSSAEAVTRLTQAGVVSATVRTFTDVAGATDVEQSGILTHGRDTTGRRFTVPTLPFRLDGVSVEADREVPRVGADDERLWSR